MTPGYAATTSANEYTQVSANPVNQIPAAVPMYDTRGNLSRDDGFDDDGNDFFEYSYDPENRLTQVEYDDDEAPPGLTVVAQYRYDALGRAAP